MKEKKSQGNQVSGHQIEFHPLILFRDDSEVWVSLLVPFDPSARTHTLGQ